MLKATPTYAHRRQRGTWWCACTGEDAPDSSMLEIWETERAMALAGGPLGIATRSGLHGVRQGIGFRRSPSASAV
jgi:hypothetical protein